MELIGMNADRLAIACEREGISLGAMMERLIRVCYEEVLTFGEAAVDGGAHSGLHSFPMARKVGATGIVYAFEAIPEVARDLVVRAASRNLGNLYVCPYALAETSGFVSFKYYPENPGYSGLEARSQVTARLGTPVELSVPSVGLDQVLPDAVRVSFVKLDLEGGELNCLKGAPRILTGDRPIVALENTPGNADAYGYNCEEYFSFFDRHEYELYDLTVEKFSEHSWDSPRTPYLLAIPREAGEVRSRLKSAVDAELA